MFCVRNTGSAYLRNEHAPTHKNGVYNKKNKKKFAHRMFIRAMNNLISVISSVENKQKMITYCQVSNEIYNIDRQIIDIVLSQIGSDLRIVN